MKIKLKFYRYRIIRRGRQAEISEILIGNFGPMHRAPEFLASMAGGVRHHPQRVLGKNVDLNIPRT